MRLWQMQEHLSRLRKGNIMTKKSISILVDSMEDICVGNGCNCGGGGCCGSTQTMETFENIVLKYREEIGESGELEILCYDKENPTYIIDELNKILRNSKQKLIANEENIEMILAEASPIIAINGIIACIQTYPPTEELARAVKTGSRISVRRTCC